MGFEDIKGIITFAIEKEQEAADFYSDLSGKVKSKDIAEELKKFAQMEMAHKKKLESVEVGKLSETKPEKIRDLKIANYTVNVVPHSNMTWSDIVNVAMHRELAAANLYSDLATITSDLQIKTLFQNLAAEEQKHKLYLETIWDQEVMKEN